MNYQDTRRRDEVISTASLEYERFLPFSLHFFFFTTSDIPLPTAHLHIGIFFTGSGLFRPSIDQDIRGCRQRRLNLLHRSTGRQHLSRDPNLVTANSQRPQASHSTGYAQRILRKLLSTSRAIVRGRTFFPLIRSFDILSGTLRGKTTAEWYIIP